MNVILIGGSGNLSADCARELLLQGHHVAAVTRGNRPVPEGVLQVTADRSDAQQLSAAISRVNPDVAIDFLGFTEDDAAMDLKVFAGEVGQLIYISSATVYRKPHSCLPITERHPLGNPFSEYARRKQSCEELLLRQSSVPVTIVRPSHTFSKKWVPNCVRSRGYTFVDRLERGLPVFVPGNGSSPWTLTASSDFATGLCGLVGRENAFGEVFHITSDEHPSWKEIYLMAAEAAGAESPDIEEIPVDFICENAPRLTAGIKGDKAEPGVFDNTKIKSFVPGFECRKTIRQALTEAITWMRSHPEDRLIDQSVHDTFDHVIDAWRRR